MTENKRPREFWIDPETGKANKDLHGLVGGCPEGFADTVKSRSIHVREVLPISESVEALAVEHANKVDDPENASWHGRYSSFKQGYTAALDGCEGKIAEGRKWKEEFMALAEEHQPAIERYRKHNVQLEKQITALRSALRQAVDQLKTDYVHTPLDGYGALIRKLESAFKGRGGE